MKKRLFLPVLIIFAFGFVFPVSTFAVFGLFDKHKSIEAVSGEVRIPVGEVSDGKAHYFSFEASGTTVKFFLVKSSDGVIRAAFDACDVCFRSKKGYTQEGDFMICNNCGRRFHTSRINIEQGGCNPAPLNRTVDGQHLVIKVADLGPGARFF